MRKGAKRTGRLWRVLARVVVLAMLGASPAALDLLLSPPSDSSGFAEESAESERADVEDDLAPARPVHLRAARVRSLRATRTPRVKRARGTRFSRDVRRHLRAARRLFAAPDDDPDDALSV